MLEPVAALPAGARVLDLGSRNGSFTADRADIGVFRLDLEIPSANKGGHYVSSDAAAMPFRDRSFDLIVSNHSLEHFVEFEQTLREIGRVVKPGGTLYVAVPDAGTLTDRIYRWLARGGGHVNPFRDVRDVIAPVERLTGLRHRSTRVLYSGLSFLNRHNLSSRPPRRWLLFGRGNERFLAVMMWVLRGIDRRLHTRLSVYGWSFYFGADEHKDEGEWINVCVRCGSGYSEAFLRERGAVDGIRVQCPVCGGFNLLTRE